MLEIDPLILIPLFVVFAVMSSAAYYFFRYYFREEQGAPPLPPASDVIEPEYQTLPTEVTQPLPSPLPAPPQRSLSAALVKTREGFLGKIRALFRGSELSDQFRD